mmetsp:Transcript_4261/g.11620  ORF Transcript_4261/g.11620 Transcript_4261/m.11620 type:complete len:241 (+) Transcript_4261:149-871(+)
METLPPQSQALNNNANAMESDGEATIVLSRPHVYQDYSPRFFCWVWPNVTPMVMPQQLQGVLPEELWHQFDQDLTAKLHRFQAVYKALEDVCAILLVALYVYHRNEVMEDNYDDDGGNEKDKIAGWLFTLIIVAAVLATFVLLALGFWCFFTMTVRFWSHGMDMFVLMPLLQQYQPIFEEEYGWQVMSETRSEPGYVRFFFTVSKVICFRRCGGGVESSMQHQEQQPGDFAPPTITLKIL